MSEFRVGQRVRLKIHLMGWVDPCDAEIIGFDAHRLKLRAPAVCTVYDTNDVELLDPADPPASDDDFGDIRWRAAELEQAKPVGYQSTYERHYAADIRRLLDALDKARRERDAVRDALCELINHATENADSDNFMAIHQLVKIAKRGLNDDHE